MIAGVELKVCGLTSADDAATAARAGADYLGFNFYPKSPRGLLLATYAGWARDLPAGKKVAIAVEPTPAELVALKTAGFDAFQVHFRAETPFEVLRGWSQAVGAANLWLAPRLPPAVDVPPDWLPLAGAIMLDTFQADRFGGTGRIGDWEKFSRHRRAHPGTNWILAGGLNPQNIAGALRESGARFVDVNSGIESAPGIKDAAKLAALVEAMRSKSLSPERKP